MMKFHARRLTVLDTNIVHSFTNLRICAAGEPKIKPRTPRGLARQYVFLVSPSKIITSAHYTRP